jgi:CBS domain containing-hemolysin-like protein
MRRRLAIALLGGTLPKAFRRLGAGVSTADLLALFGESGLVPEDLSSLIAELGEFRDILVREVMVPRTNMICVPEDISAEDVVRVSIEQGFSRYPVYRDGIDSIVGILHAKDLLPIGLGKEVDIHSVMRPVHFVPETKKILALLRELQGRKNHLSIVLDEYGGVSGLITMEDLLEQVLGEIQDEFDEGEPATVVSLPDGGWEVAGGLEIRELEDLLGTEIARRGFDTVAGLIYERLGGIPRAGDRTPIDGHTFEVVALDGHRITRVRILPIPGEPEEVAGDGTE